MSLFKSFGNVPIIEERPATPAEMAADLAMETIEGILNQREEAKARELACEPPLPVTEEDKQRYETLEALIGTPAKPGPHRATVLPLILEAFPELVTPAKLAEELKQGDPE